MKILLNTSLFVTLCLFISINVFAQEDNNQEDDYDPFENFDDHSNDETTYEDDASYEQNAEDISKNESPSYDFKYKIVDINTFNPLGYWSIVGSKKIDFTVSRFVEISNTQLRNSCRSSLIHIGKGELVSNATCFYNYCRYSSYSLEMIDIDDLRNNLKYSDFVRSLATALYFEIKAKTIPNIRFNKRTSPFAYHDMYIVNDNTIIVFFDEILYFLVRNDSFEGTNPSETVVWEQKGNRLQIQGYSSTKLFVKLKNPKLYPYLRVTAIPPKRGSNDIVISTVSWDEDENMTLKEEFTAIKINYRQSASIKYNKIERDMIVVDLNTYKSEDFPWSLTFTFLKK